MAPNIETHVGEAPRKMLAMRGEGLRKRLVERDDEGAKRRFGRVIDRTFTRAAITKQSAARDLDYGDNQAPISNWISGRENAQLWRMWAYLGREFRLALIVELANDANDNGDDIEVRTTVTVTNTRRAAG